jgi:hypothetical protein
MGAIGEEKRNTLLPVICPLNCVNYGENAPLVGDVEQTL